MEITTRNADMAEIVNLLLTQRAMRRDFVVPASKLTVAGGILEFEDPELAELTDEGVTPFSRYFDLNGVALAGFSEKLGIPAAYLAKLHAGRVDLFDANVNGWLKGGSHGDRVWPADDRSFLLRTFIGDDPSVRGVARALLSNGFKIVDNLDMLAVAMAAVMEADPDANVVSANLSERNMTIKVMSPNLVTEAPVLHDGYKSPFEGPNPVGRAGGITDASARLKAIFGDHHIFNRADAPIVAGGFTLGNSEVGAGSAYITPWAMMLRCTNGLTFSEDRLRKTHLGGRMAEGDVKW